jgi:hypothetical protein
MVRSSASKKVKTTGKALDGELLSAESPEITSDALPPNVLAQVLTAEDVYVSPEALAAMTGLDERWFAGARQGEKEVAGPPFVKLGTSKSSPVRYNLADVRKWWAQFPKQVSTHGKVSAFRSAGEFFKTASPTARWLFAEVAGEPIDIVLAVRSGAFSDDNQPRVAWLTFPEWIERAWRSDRLHSEISAALRPLREAALASYEQHAFESEIRKVPETEPRRIDDPPSAAPVEDVVIPQEPARDRRL